MRTAFIETLCKIAQTDERIWLLTGDLGFSVLERFRESFPERFVNAGVAEQNMTGVAAGLALCGKIVFVYSITNFPTFRCLEQIRNDLCYHGLPVKIVSVGGGFAYGSQGFTHHNVEDLAIMRSLPNMTVVAPGDPKETEMAMRALVDRQGPAYLRLGKAGEPSVHSELMDFEIGKAIQVRNGGDITLISTGGMLKTTVDVAENLASENRIEATVLSMHTLKPLDSEAVHKAVRETGGVITVEEHRITGGLGSAVAEVIAESPASTVLFRRFGVPDQIATRTGDQSYMRRMCGDLQTEVVKLVKGRGSE